jgi:hypothetical protein
MQTNSSLPINHARGAASETDAGSG